MELYWIVLGTMVGTIIGTNEYIYKVPT